PETKNYVMVMKYMDGGNLRQLLQNENRELNLEDKLNRLKYITYGLSTIHDQNLVHRDFHSGNILNNSDKYFKALISDLGLSCLVNSQKQGGEIFG
ncbi:7539_t:CDS:1, partial [Cetraspora pellucida]